MSHTKAIAGLLDRSLEKRAVKIIEALKLIAYMTADSKGWHEKKRDDLHTICLIHSELSEAAEAIRRDDPPDDKIPEFCGSVAELADTIIRIFDYAEGRKLPLGKALVAKMKFNLTRPYRHGGKKF